MNMKVHSACSFITNSPNLHFTLEVPHSKLTYKLKGTRIQDERIQDERIHVEPGT